MADFAEEGAGKAGGFLKKKAGPLEYWQWAAATLGVVFAYLAYRNHVSASAGAPASAPATDTSLPGTGGNPTDLGTTISGQLTDLTGQVGALQNTVAGLTSGAAATTTQSTNGFSSDVSNLYELTGRSPDTSGAQYWQGVVNSQGLTSAFNQFAATPEAQGYAASNPAGFSRSRVPDGVEPHTRRCRRQCSGRVSTHHAWAGEGSSGFQRVGSAG